LYPEKPERKFILIHPDNAATPNCTARVRGVSKELPIRLVVVEFEPIIHDREKEGGTRI